MIQGIDISQAQGVIDFVALRAGGFRFCIVKATEGVDYEDPRFRSSLAAMAALPTAAPRFYPGAYHFGRPDNHPGRRGGEDEAGQFARVLQQAAQACDLSLATDFFEPVVDFERYCQTGDGCTTADRTDWIDGFLAVLQAETGRRGMIYTGANTWQNLAGDTDRFALAGVLLWQVAYSRSGADPSGAPPRIPKNTARTAWTPALWQWSGGGEFAYYGSVPGVPNTTDVDRLIGDESLLTELTRTSTAAIREAPALDPRADPWPPPVNLADLTGACHPCTARVQGLLLALGYGPQGLVASANGLPDGIHGSKTDAAIRAFKRAHGLADDARVDETTWWWLVNSSLR